MYCKQCYEDLSAAPGQKCPKCGRAFKAYDPRTYLKRPFPGPGRIALHVVLTTAFAGAAAFVVAFHQMARTSGH
jgi:hypothetical protein